MSSSMPQLALVCQLYPAQGGGIPVKLGRGDSISICADRRPLRPKASNLLLRGLMGNSQKPLHALLKPKASNLLLRGQNSWEILKSPYISELQRLSQG
eukprot:719964-Prorocentrum_minimum.AAC.1